MFVFLHAEIERREARAMLPDLGFNVSIAGIDRMWSRVSKSLPASIVQGGAKCWRIKGDDESGEASVLVACGVCWLLRGPFGP